MKLFIFGTLWLLLIASIYIVGWWKYRKNPKRHGTTLINIMPSDEPAIWCCPVTYRKFTTKECIDEGWM